MATYYEILGLDDHPADMKAAKRAYAKKLRVTRPDDDPEGFMKLREALDIAKREITWREQDAAYERAEIEINDAPDSVETTQISEDNRLAETQPLPEIEPQTEPDATVQDIELTGDQILMSKFSKAFNDPFLKNDKAHWSRLFDEISELSIDEHLDFDERFRGALVNAYSGWIDDKKEKPLTSRPLPATIENLIFDKMEWRFLQDIQSYKAQQIDWLKSQFDLYNRPTPHDVQQAREQANQPPKFEDDGIGLPKIIWRVARLIIIIAIIRSCLEHYPIS